MANKILRLKTLRERFPRGRSTIYNDIKSGLMVAPVAIGARCSGWPEHEVDAILAARIAGASESEIRELVTRLHAARKALTAKAA